MALLTSGGWAPMTKWSSPNGVYVAKRILVDVEKFGQPCIPVTLIEFMHQVIYCHKFVVG